MSLGLYLKSDFIGWEYNVVIKYLVNKKGSFDPFKQLKKFYYGLYPLVAVLYDHVKSLPFSFVPFAPIA